MVNGSSPQTPSLRSAGFLGLLFVLWLGVPALAELHTDLAWFESVGYAPAYMKIFWTRIGLAVAAGAGLALLMYASGRLALRNAGGPMIAHIGQSPIPGLGAAVSRALLPVSLALGAFGGFVASHGWETFLLWRNRGDFGTAEPLFSKDVGFHVFDIPLIEGVRAYLFWAVALSLIVATLIYVAHGMVHANQGRFRAHPKALQHIGVLVGLIFLLLALDAWLASMNLLRSTRGPVAGASYADVHAALPALWVSIATALIAAAASFIVPRTGRLLWWAGAIALHILVVFVGVRTYPTLVQRFSVEPNEEVKEAPFIEHNIAATRHAYGLSEVVSRDLEGEEQLTRQDIDNNRPTIDNIRLWDHKPLLETFAQIQEIRTYYDFASVDNDRYIIDGALRQIMLSPRELAASSLPNRTWINEHFTFTHGYGLTLGPVNEATDEGLPKLYIQDIPPESSRADLSVTRPEIYFGELSNDYVFVRAKAQEFNHPSGNENVFSRYEGKAGVSLKSLLTRITMSLRLRTLKLLLSNDIVDETRVLLFRNVRQRIAEIAPFLALDSDTYMMIDDEGHLHWVQDAYTTTDRYPYSERRGPLNYIRNAVKVVVDAYDGDVSLYINDPSDPLIAAWARAFPQLFKPIADMPADQLAHLRYPRDLFDLQANVFTTYHMQTASLVYSREDQREIPSIDSRSRMEPYYTVMRLPGEKEAEFILMLPFTPKRKLNLAAWMVARNDGEHRGQLVIYRFPKDKLIYGPRQIMNRVNQDELISEQRTLWDQQGSQAIFGTLLVIPIEESLIYVVPLYLKSEAPPIPQLKRVIVVYGDQIAMRETLDQAIDAVFTGESARAPRPAPAAKATGEPAKRPPPMAATAKNAQKLFEAAQKAQREGDWAAYGRHLDALGAALKALAKEAKNAK